MGNLYALDAETGTQEWVYPVGAPILNSVAVGEGKVFFGAMDGEVYALDVATGVLVWRAPLLWRHGFSTAPVLADGKVMLGGRNGRFYALAAASGETIWCWPPEDEPAIAPILQTAAWNDGRVFFGAMDMHLYGIDTGSGRLTWRSERIPGMAFKDYWPVVHEGMVYIRPMGMGELGVGDPALVTDPAAQQAVLADYEANPEAYEITLRRFFESTGEEAPVVIHYRYPTMNGATSPPCVDRNGHLAVPAPYPESGRFEAGWGRLDVSSRILVDVLHDGTEAGYGNQDENMNLTCTGNLIIAMHTQEYNAQYTGAYDLDHQSWTRLPAGHTSRQMSTNTQGGGGNPASVANGVVYHISFHELIARRTQQ